MPRGTAVIFGAGRIGRGFAGDLFAAAGYRLTFVDAAEALVAQMRAAGRYTVVHARGAGERADRVISGFTALSTADAEAVAAAVAGADCWPWPCSRGISRRWPGNWWRAWRGGAGASGAPLDIVLCCNLAHAGPAFRAALAAALPAETVARLGVIETLVIRMVAEPPAEELAHDPLLVWTNGYGEFPVDRRAWQGEIPPVPAFRLVDDMRAEEMRKLYSYNTFHAALAYHGALRGIERVVDCLADAQVSAAAEGALAEAAAALRAEYGFGAEEMARWCAGVRAQTDNATLGDTVRRFGAIPGASWPAPTG
jgi:mannitol-1-phosphate 5-dehydrogenase